MLVTLSIARDKLCPDTGIRRKKCVATDCMGWRPVVLYATFVTDPDEKGVPRRILRWSLTAADGAQPIECGYCGKAGAPAYTDMLAQGPQGFDERDVIGLISTTDEKRVRSLNSADRQALTRQGKISVTDDGVRSPTGAYYPLGKPPARRKK